MRRLKRMQAKKLLEEALLDPKTKTILNLGAGKIDYIFMPKEKQLVVNVDSSYKSSDNVNDIELLHLKFMDVNTYKNKYIKYTSMDLFDFMDSYKYKFDLIIANRIFEHQFYDSGSIGRLSSACHYLLNDDGKMYILVPNHLRYAELIMHVEKEHKTMKHSKFASHVLEINTEFCNTRSDPHGSIWTPELAKFYIESEGVWTIMKMYEDIEWDGRVCYMMMILVK